MYCQNKKRAFRFFTPFKRQVLLFKCILSAIIATSAFPAQDQEKWVPDYDNRDTWQQPEKIMDAIGVKTGIIIADVGAGKGYFTFKLAKRVGPEGKIYATDIDEHQLKTISDRVQREGIKKHCDYFGERR